MAQKRKWVPRHVFELLYAEQWFLENVACKVCDGCGCRCCCFTGEEKTRQERNKAGKNDPKKSKGKN